MKGGDGVRGFRSVTNDADAWLDLAWAPTAAELAGLPRGAFRAVRFAHYEGDTAAGRAGAAAAGAKAVAGAAGTAAAPAAASALAEIELPVPLALCGGAAPTILLVKSAVKRVSTR